MPNKQILAFTLIVSSTVALSACKRHDQPAVAGNLPVASAVAPAPVAPVTAPAPAAAPAAPSAAAAPPPAASQDAPATPASGSFDVSRIAVTKATLPPFPYLGWPETLPEGSRNIKSQEFDRAYFIVGKEVHPVEGHVERRYFYNDDAKLSKLGAERNYESVLTALGAVQVNAIGPDSPEIDKRHMAGGLHDGLFAIGNSSYRAYLIRTPEKNIWLSVSVTDGRTQFMTVDEQAMKQSVRLTSAAPRSQ